MQEIIFPNLLKHIKNLIIEVTGNLSDKKT